MSIASDKITNEIDKYINHMAGLNRKPESIALTKWQFERLIPDIRKLKKYRGFDLRIVD
ncbi:MAG: hypothetical protein O7D95_02250 [Betaproteobacteria bacterium]|nr:hypothetical protein [Betaproteobacteria bacterium]